MFKSHQLPHKTGSNPVLKVLALWQKPSVTGRRGGAAEDTPKSGWQRKGHRLRHLPNRGAGVHSQQTGVADSGGHLGDLICVLVGAMPFSAPAVRLQTPDRQAIFVAQESFYILSQIRGSFRVEVVEVKPFSYLYDHALVFPETRTTHPRSF